MERHITYCRICLPQCGLQVDVDDGRIVRVRPDRDNPMSRGYSCPKGRSYGYLHERPDRIRTTLRRDQHGELRPADYASATVDIGRRLRQLVDRHGPHSVGLFRGTQSYFATLARPMSLAWLRGIGSAKLFSPSTIDQSAKSVAWGRMGVHAGGLQAMLGSDVLMLVGINPLVSHIGGVPSVFPVCDPVARLREAKDEGLALIVIDPRRTETARHADLFLQPIPGHDAIVLAATLHVILGEELHDVEFCARLVGDLDHFRAAIAEATPQLAAERAGVRVDDLVAVARTFGRARRGAAVTGTGPDMGPASNLAEHLVACLNVVCGRYVRAGEPVVNPGVMQPRVLRDEVHPPSREWEHSFHSRIGGHGTINGELPSGILADEILEPGDDRIRALVVVGANPAACLPDQVRAVEALRSLELLVTIDPLMTETARLADYVIAPVLPFERDDHTMPMEHFFPVPFAQYTDALLERPPGTVEEWEFFWDLAREMDVALKAEFLSGECAPERFAAGRRPSSAALLERLATGTRVPLDEIRRHRHGMVLERGEEEVRGPAATGGDARFTLLPPDVAAELRRALDGVLTPSERTHVLTVRRTREAMNSLGRDFDPAATVNPAYLHPDDLRRLGLDAGADVELRSNHGTIDAVAMPDDTVRPGVVSMSHCFGSLPGDGCSVRDVGSNPSRLISTTEDVETINAMPRMSAIPVDVIARSQ